MPDSLAGAFATTGLIWMVLASFLAGIVRGFAGFGSGLVLLPVTAMFLTPFSAIAAMTIADFAGPVPLVRKAVRDVHLPDLWRLVGAMAVGLPFGVALLSMLDATVFRTVISVLAFVMLACLISGLRYRGELTPRLVLATGGLSGVLGGTTGLPGPPVILLYLASHLPAAVVRATTLLFLFLYDIGVLVVFALGGKLLVQAVVIGIILAVPNVLGNLAGAALFQLRFERFYRICAYGIIATIAVLGLPIWR
jgi:uncharacterized membrane protein YfcA